jgi:hypothetical protein
MSRRTPYQAYQALHELEVCLRDLSHADHDRLITRLATAMGEPRTYHEMEARRVLAAVRKLATDPAVEEDELVREAARQKVGWDAYMREGPSPSLEEREEARAYLRDLGVIR